MWNFGLLSRKKLGLKSGLLILLCIKVFFGCSAKVPSPEAEQTFEKYKAILENATSPKVVKDEQPVSIPSPIFKEISPLQKRINVAFYQEHYESVLFFLAYEAGLSMVIDPSVKREITPDRERITLQMKNQPLEEVLKKVCDVLDIHYKIDRGVLKITPFEEKFFNLGFLPVVKEGRTTMGGDVLGGIGQTGQVGVGLASSPLKGDFSINAEISKATLDIYSSLREILSTIVGNKGEYNLNKLTGVLYVKAKPSVMSAVSKVIEEFKKKYSKQIILDAQIIEVELGKGHTLGIDWFEITNYLMGNNRVSFNTLDLTIAPSPNQPTLALTISGQPRVSLLINLLKEYGEVKVISNPKIRVLHSQPALISVGTSHSFVREIKREIIPGPAGTTTVAYTPQTSSIFEGILLGITPYITENEEIFLHIVPIKSDLVELRDTRFENFLITLPRINLREMTSIVKAKPNDLIVLGGLILDRDRGIERKVNIPILSEIFKTQQVDSRKAELVILIRLIID